MRAYVPSLARQGYVAPTTNYGKIVPTVTRSDVNRIAQEIFLQLKMSKPTRPVPPPYAPSQGDDSPSWPHVDITPELDKIAVLVSREIL